MIPAAVANGLAYGLPFIAKGLDFLFNKSGAKAQEASNMRLAKYQNEKNMELLKYQLDYNTPAAQMQRYKDANLNPNLIYGQGTPGNMSETPKYPDIGRVDYQSMYTDLGTKTLQNQLLASQVDLTKNKADESGAKRELMQAQENLVRANPYMRKEYVNALVMQLESTAKMKEQEWNWRDTFVQSQTKDGEFEFRKKGFLLMDKQMDQLFQKFDLGSADQKIKAEILKSESFKNELKKLQVEWMKNAEITPQHIYQAIMMIISKLM